MNISKLAGLSSALIKQIKLEMWQYLVTVGDIDKCSVAQHLVFEIAGKKQVASYQKKYQVP